MHTRKLLEVEDHFAMSGKIGLVVTPDFSVPNTHGRIDFMSTARVDSPAGGSEVLDVHIGVWHLNIPTTADVDKRWRVVVSFPHGSKEAVPIGSSVYVSESDYEKVRGVSA